MELLKEIQYLEHILLLLGSKKYPEVDDFGTFVGQHGGSSNAETDDLHTKFYFNIPPENFLNGLDRLADCFISPLFNENYLEKERKSVDAEFRLHLVDNDFRWAGLFSQIVNQAHPESRFTVGNVETLPGPNHTMLELRDAAIKFFETFYFVENMIFVAGGPQTISELESMANQTFGKITR